MFDIKKYKVLPSSELHDTGCKERKLCNIKIKTEMNLNTKIGLVLMLPCCTRASLMRTARMIDHYSYNF